VTLRRMVERQLPVLFDHAFQERIGQVALEPATVTVRGPQEVLDHVRAIPTQRYTHLPAREPGSRPDAFMVESIPLVAEMEGRRIRALPDSVKAHISVQPRQKNYELSDVPVEFLCPANFPLKPLFRDERAGKITLRLVGPFGEEAPTVTAFIDLGGRKWEPGLYEEPLKLQLPKDFQLAQSPPRLVAFQLVPLEAPVKAAGGGGE